MGKLVGVHVGRKRAGACAMDERGSVFPGARHKAREIELADHVTALLNHLPTCGTTDAVC